MSPEPVVKSLGATGIPYADYGWNVTRGCSKDGRAGCLNCWAARQCATRLKHLPAYAGLAERRPQLEQCDVCDGLGDVNDREWGVTHTCGECGGHGIIESEYLPEVYDWTGEVRFDAAELERPLHTKKPGIVFTVPRGDLFHEQVTDDEIAAAFGVMDHCPHLTFLVLTKRWHRMRQWFEMMAGHYAPGACAESALRVLTEIYGRENHGDAWPLPNVQLIVSVWDQASADAAIPDLLETPAAVRGVSVEPMLGDLDLSPWLGPHMGLTWVVCGPETGPGKRPFESQWAALLRNQCVAADVAYYDKRESHKGWREMPEVRS